MWRRNKLMQSVCEILGRSVTQPEMERLFGTNRAMGWHLPCHSHKLRRDDDRIDEEILRRHRLIPAPFSEP